jgi:MYXO-CTERM domain-containing protein
MSMQDGGVFEAHGVLLGADTFASGLVGADDYTGVIAQADVGLSQSSPAVDAGLALPGLAGAIAGAGPDLGAQELGCAAPIYGPRPDGVDEATPMADCGGSGGETDGETGEETSGETGGGETGGETGGATTGEEPTTGAPTTGDGGTSGGAGTGGPTTSGADTGAATGGEGGDSGCGCRSGGGGGLLALGLLGLLRRRRRG